MVDVQVYNNRVSGYPSPRYCKSFYS